MHLCCALLHQEFVSFLRTGALYSFLSLSSCKAYHCQPHLQPVNTMILCSPLKFGYTVSLCNKIDLFHFLLLQVSISSLNMFQVLTKAHCGWIRVIRACFGKARECKIRSKLKILSSCIHPTDTWLCVYEQYVRFLLIHILISGRCVCYFIYSVSFQKYHFSIDQFILSNS